MKVKLIILLALLLSELASFAQETAKSYFWVKFKDKEGTPFQIDHPEKFLSQRSIDRRLRQHIPIDQTDLPVSPDYLDSLENRGLEIFHTSKWLNGATVRMADTTLIREIAKLPFVEFVQFTRPANVLKSGKQKFGNEKIDEEYVPAYYGNAINQLTQLNGQFLHQQSFRGKGVQIAILDAGFYRANQIAAFDSLRNSGRLLGIHDFVNPNSDIYQEHWHGMSVLSCMGGNLPGNFIGTAPDASFYLFRSEDDPGEYITEEDNWVAAAELADSLGVDVINSSLGYTEFDDPQMNHSYSDLDGKTTRVTQGANMAFQKGILVFNSAGNEGQNPWAQIVAPADGVDVISVAAVDINGDRAPFSSAGPAFGGAIKPNVAARGASTYLITSNGTPGYSSGTSFSSPVLAGMGACLIQANPFANVKQLKLAIEQSASQFAMPDSLLGFGIPDFEKADKYLKVNSVKYLNWPNSWAVSPNPFSDFLFIRNLDSVFSEISQIRIYNLSGVCLWNSSVKNEGTILLNELSTLPEGFLILSIHSGDLEERIKLVKINR